MYMLLLCVSKKIIFRRLESYLKISWAEGKVGQLITIHGPNKGSLIGNQPN
jgi:hypothetical protein